MAKKTKEVQVTMDMLLRMKPDLFLEFIKSQPMGFNLSLRNILKAQFEQCNATKDALLHLLAQGRVPQQDKEDINKTVKDLYISMQLIEDRHTIVDLHIQGQN